MITREKLIEALALANDYWAVGNTDILHAMWGLLEGIDEDDAIYEMAHICARRKLTIDTYVSALKILGFEVGGDT